MRRIRRLALLAVLVVAPVPAGAGELPRRPYVGLAVAPLAPQVRDEIGFSDPGGLLITQVLEGSGAESAGARVGDVLLALGPTFVATPSDFIEAAARYEAKDRVRLLVWRDGIRVALRVLLRPIPLEPADGYEVEYGQVSAPNGDRLRTVVTLPRDPGPHPALLLIGGVGCASADNPFLDLGHTRELLGTVTRRGWMTMRVDKPGVGDSEGGPCPELGFDQELDTFRAAYRALRSDPRVDGDHTVILGLSMGGVMAPILAKEQPTAGIVVYGTIYRPFFEYFLETWRRQKRLEGATPAEVRREIDDHLLFGSRFYVDGLSMEAIFQEHPRLRALFPDAPLMFAGKHHRFFREVHQLDLAAAWSSVACPVLAIWGTSDYVSCESDHVWLARTVDLGRPGRATLLRLPEADHWFNRAESFEASHTRGVLGEMHPGVPEAILHWLDSTPPQRPESGVAEGDEASDGDASR